MSLDDDIATVNAFADLLASYPLGKFSLKPDEHDKRALMEAALEILDAVQDWTEIEKRHDGQHLVLLAPDGSQVLYSYDQEGEQFVERLKRCEESSAALL